MSQLDWQERLVALWREERPISASKEGADPDVRRLIYAAQVVAHQRKSPNLSIQKRGSGDSQKSGRLEAMAEVVVDSAEVDAWVEGQLQPDTKTRMCEILARAGVGWDFELSDHETLAEAPSQLLVAALGRAPALEQIVREATEQRLVRRAARACAATGFTAARDAVDSVLERLGSVEHAEPFFSEMLLLAETLAPDRLARKRLTGQLPFPTEYSGRLVCDYLQRFGPTSWLETLCVLDLCESQGFEMASRFAFGASEYVSRLAVNEVPEADEALQKLLTEYSPFEDPAPEWQNIATECGMQYQLATYTEDALALLACQIAAHEALVFRDEPSPGVPGLPFSSNAAELVDSDSARALADECGESNMTSLDRIAHVKSLLDVAEWATADPAVADRAGPYIERTEQLSDPAIKLARRRLQFELGTTSEAEARRLEADPDLRTLFVARPTRGPASELTRQAAQTGSLVAMQLVRHWARQPTFEAGLALSKCLETGSIWRAPFYRDAFAEWLSLLVDNVENS